MSHRMTKAVVLVSAVFAFLMVGVSQVAARTVTVGINAFPRTLDPTFDTTARVMAVYRTVYEPLVVADDNGAMLPALAEEWKLTDAQTWQIRLRKGVKFHNGDEMTSEDVKFTIERVLDPKTKAIWKSRIAAIAKVETPDRSTVVIRTSQPFATLIKHLSVIYILPAKLWRTRGEEKFLDPPVGTGPFKFVQWTRDSEIRLQRNDGYWGRKPESEAVTFKYMPENATRLAALEAGEIDIATDVPPEQVEPLRKKSIQITTRPIGLSQVVQLRSTGSGPLTDKRVRQGINYAVDKDAIVKSLFLGYARKLEGQLVGPDGFGFDPALKAYPYDPAKAKELLREAGYAQGFDVTWDTASGLYPKDKELAEVVAAQLADVGIRVKINILESAAYRAKMFAGASGPMFPVAWQYLPAMDAELPLTWHQTESIFKLMSDPEFDRMFVEQRNMKTDAERLVAVRKIAGWFREYAPALFLYQMVTIYATRPGTDKVGFRPDFTMDFTETAVRR